MVSRYVGMLFVFGVLTVVAVLLPLAAAGPPPPTALALAAVLTAIVFSAAVSWIAWWAGEWPPVLLSLGCISMAATMTGQLAPALLPFEVSENAGRNVLPALGMIAGGVCFGFGAIPRRLTANADRRRPRGTLLVASVAIAMGAVLVPSSLASLPVSAIRVAAAIASLGYLYAALQMTDAFRLLRLPSQFAMALGCVVFVPMTLFSAVGGIPALPPALQIVAALASAALPVSGFIIEHRTRPGLRTMVLALSVPGAVRAMRRGYPAQLNDLLTDVDSYSPELRGHVDRVADLAILIARQMGVEGADLREVMLAAQLHDVGKLFVPREILEKPGRLDPGEFAQMQEHATLGANLVRRIPELAGAAAAVAQHHERWDGRGYPDGRSGEDLRLSARIIAAADVFDALTSERAYKRAWSTDDAVDELRKGVGSQFDPDVVRAIEFVVSARDEFALAA